jgi:hypothetical protein
MRSLIKGYGREKRLGYTVLDHESSLFYNWLACFSDYSPAVCDTI